MTLVDTSVWVDHMRHAVPALNELLMENLVLRHPMVFGELFMGRPKNEAQFFEKYLLLPDAIVAANDEVIKLVQKHKLRGSGLSWIDCHLLASARLSSADLLSHDLAMAQAWAKLKPLH